MNVLIYGYGSIAAKHIGQLQELYPQQLKVFALRSDRNKASSIDGITNIFDESELDEQIDFVIISNPTYLRERTLKKAVQLKKPLFIEKPSLFTLDNVGEISSLLKKSGLITYVACNLRFHPCLLFLKERLTEQSAKVEEVNIYCGSYLPTWRNVDYRNCYSAHADQGGGVHLDLIHELDYCYWLFGSPSNVRSCRKSQSHLDISAVDYANYLLEFQGFVACITLNYFRRNKKRSIEIVTSEGTWLADLVRNKVYYNDQEQVVFTDFSILDTYKSQLVYFLEHVHANKQPMNSFHESVEVLKIALS